MASSVATDSILSLDLGPNDCLYRIRRRVSGTRNRVVYVTITNLAVIPEEKRTYGPSVVEELSKLREWNQDWSTLRVHMEDGHVWCEADAFQPHAVPKDRLHDERYPSYNISDLEVLYKGQPYYLKLARFPHELPFLFREMDAYHSLAQEASVFRLAPKLVAYVFEETPDRVTGFLVEPVQGRVADTGDLLQVAAAVAELHRVLVHGDLCKYNIFMTSDGPRFIDFEVSTTVSEATGRRLAEEELEGLAGKLADESGAGRPWGWH
ncbi:hypothetical protein N658DRAFT_487403 [Parathielavia hyrcaniae]|uniref:non-specific serine/threonine protein kinase n=1 Tax=Parathielavia hyrcaniae TaxID=113614 RepID=A0AAN6T034_9PEZI|nr:hypothetical protein N658DRAFT_487403 [Parathielavia hyrcaniae]